MRRYSAAILRAMPANLNDIRLERFQAEMAYHAAYLYWNLRGVLAERWAHGPIFGGYKEEGDQITLSPAVTPDQTDRRLHAVYGLRASGVHAEGPLRAQQAREVAADWISDVVDAFNPKRVVRVQVSTFSLYPVVDPVQASRKLRNAYYKNEPLRQLLPDSLRQHQDHFHSALDLLVPTDKRGGAVSVVVGVVGPTNIGEFFIQPDPERDARWWMGIRYLRNELSVEGIDDPKRAYRQAVDLGMRESSELFTNVLHEILA